MWKEPDAISLFVSLRGSGLNGFSISLSASTSLNFPPPSVPSWRARGFPSPFLFLFFSVFLSSPSPQTFFFSLVPFVYCYKELKGHFLIARIPSYQADAFNTSLRDCAEARHSGKSSREGTRAETYRQSRANASINLVDSGSTGVLESGLDIRAL